MANARIGHSTEVFVYTGSAAWAVTDAIFVDTDPAVGPGNGVAGSPYIGYTNQPLNFARVGGIRDVDGPSMSSDEVEVTTNDSPQQWKEFIAGLKDGGDISFDMIYDIADATQSGADADAFAQIFDAQATRHWAIRVPTLKVGQTTTTVEGTAVVVAAATLDVFANHSFFIFDGFVKEMGQAMQMSEAIMRNVAIKVSGNVVFPQPVTA